MTTELEQSIMSSLYNINSINISEINKILFLIENSCKKYKDRVYYKIQYYYIEPIMKQIKTRKFMKNDNPFINELKNEYLSLFPNQSQEWLDRVYNEFNQSFDRMTEDREYYFIHEKYPKRNNEMTTIYKQTTKYTCCNCGSEVLLSSRKAHEKTDKCIYFGKEKENPNYKEKALPKNTIVKCCDDCNHQESKNHIARHRNKCEIFISSKTQV